MAKKFEGRIDAIYREIETTKGVIRRLPELEESLKGLAEQRRKQFKETQKMFARLSVELMLGRGGDLCSPFFDFSHALFSKLEDVGRSL
uniref:Uncharacterized protein n=1 Tax=Cucumis sativus TaxID=3659 RepID=A0A0A0KY12_CUCSA